MKPFDKRTPDTQYRDVLQMVLKEGVVKKNEFQTTGRLTHLTTPLMVFDLSNGAPLITERDLPFWRKGVAEIIAFINGARTLGELRHFGGEYWPSWWKYWVTPEKCGQFGLESEDMGPGSYGPGLSRDNQIQRVVDQVRKYPGMSTHVIDPWQPDLVLQDEHGKRQVVVAPCHGWVQITVIDGKLHLRMDQRSADVPIGVPMNMIQYTALLLMFAQVTGYEPGLFIHSLHDAQIYEDQVESVHELLEREPRPFPTLRITEPGITNILDFRAEHFELKDYYPHPAMKDIAVTE